MSNNLPRPTTVRRILAISGSLRTGSYNRALLVEAGRLAPPEMEVTIYDQLAAVPPFSEDLESAVPLAVTAWRLAIAEADALLIATPEYNGSIPGQLKNALDWASRPRGHAVLTGKRVATASASPGRRGAAGAQAELRKVLTVAGAWVMGDEVTLAEAHRHLDDSGRLDDSGIRERLAANLALLVEADDALAASA
jgi:chromate reductase